MRLPVAVDLGDMQAPGKLLRRQIKGENTVETSAGYIQFAIVNTDFVEVLEIGVAELAKLCELLVINEQLIAGGDVYFPVMECDAAKAAIPTSS